MRLRLIARYVSLLCGFLLLVTVLGATAIHVHQYILRRRAEALLADMQSIDLRKSTYQDAQWIFHRWQRWGKYEGACSSSQCTMDIRLADPTTFANQLIHSHLLLFNLAWWLGDRPDVAIHARLIVLQGTVWADAFEFRMEVPGRYPDGGEYLEPVGGAAVSVRRIPQFRYGYPGWERHPEYVIWSATNLPNLIRLDFTPFAKSDEIHRLMFLNFGCLTRMTPCGSGKDIMPTAVAQKIYWSSLTPDPDGHDYLCENPDGLFLELAARDARNVVTATAGAQRPGPEPEQPLVIERILKAAAPSALRAVSHPWMYAGQQSDTRIPAGTPVILFLKDDNLNGLSLEGCGPLAATPDHLSAISRGIEKDTRPSRLPESGLYSVVSF